MLSLRNGIVKNAFDNRLIVTEKNVPLLRSGQILIRY